VTGRYLALLARPLHLSADYSFDQIPIVTSPADPLTLTSAAALLLLAVLAVHGLAASRPPRLGGLLAVFFLIALAPVSNLAVPIGTVMAERLLYLPSIPFCLALPALWRETRRAAPRALGAPWVGAGVLVALAGLYTVRTIGRNDDWRDQLTLFSVTTVTSPRRARAHYNLGVALEDAGRPAEALRQYLFALSIKPEDAKSHHNAGLILATMGRAPEASLHLEQASRQDPTLPKVFSSLGAVYSRLGRADDAETAFREAIKRDPADHVALYNLGTLALIGGRPGEAVGPLEKARDIAPTDADSRYQLGLAYLEAGRPRDAVGEMRRAISLSPDLPGAHLQLARALLRLGMRDEAAIEATRARAGGEALPPELEDLIRIDAAHP